MQINRPAEHNHEVSRAGEGILNRFKQARQLMIINKEKIDRLIEHADQYLETEKELAELVIIEKTGRVFAASMSGLILVMLSMLVLVFSGIAIACVIAYLTGELYIGFVAIALLFLLLAALLYTKRAQLLSTPLLNLFIRMVLKKHEEGN